MRTGLHDKTITLAGGKRRVAPLTARGYGIARAAGFDPLDPKAYDAFWTGGRHCDPGATILAVAAILAGGLTEAEPRDGFGAPLHTWTREEVIDRMLDTQLPGYSRAAVGLLRGLKKARRKGAIHG